MHGCGHNTGDGGPTRTHRTRAKLPRSSIRVVTGFARKQKEARTQRHEEHVSCLGAVANDSWTETIRIGLPRNEPIVRGPVSARTRCRRSGSSGHHCCTVLPSQIMFVCDRFPVLLAFLFSRFLGNQPFAATLPICFTERGGTPVTVCIRALPFFRPC